MIRPDAFLSTGLSLEQSWIELHSQTCHRVINTAVRLGHLDYGPSSVLASERVNVSGSERTS